MEYTIVNDLYQYDDENVSMITVMEFHGCLQNHTAHIPAEAACMGNSLLASHGENRAFRLPIYAGKYGFLQAFQEIAAILGAETGRLA